jgi:GDP-D-mannose 3', 5'-epimerase
MAGVGGFIGGHLVRHLLDDRFWVVRAVDIKPLADWCQVHRNADNRVLDLSAKDAAFAAVEGAKYVINLAGDMGGMGFIETHKAECMLSVLINTHLLMAAPQFGVRRVLLCVIGLCLWRLTSRRVPM